ncbi:MAG: hypothetical protein E7654_09035 [Ruminococcaceae bacterium]|nr:hypothetical protein [Oscillospiraceae bacterium]
MRQDNQQDKKLGSVSSDQNVQVNDNSDDYAVRTGRAQEIIARVLCALAAIILWLYVMSIDTPNWEKTFTGIMVNIENETQLAENYNMSVISGFNNTVSVTVKGTKNDVNKCTAADLTAYVDLLGIDESGRHQLAVTALADAGLTVVDVSPSTIWVYTDQIATKTVKVDVALYYQIATNLGLGTTETNIQEVTVEGPADVLETIACARAELDLGQITTSMTQRAQLTLVDHNGNPITNPYVKSDATNVLVTVPVFVYKTVPVTVSFKHGYLNSENANVTITPSQITVKGDPQLLEDFDVYPLIELDDTKVTDNYSRLVKLTLPEGISDADRIGNVTVTVNHVGTSTKPMTVETDDFQVIAPDGMEYAFPDDIFNFVLRGPDSLITRVRPEHIKVTVDLTHYAQMSGPADIPVMITPTSSSLVGKVYAEGTYNIQVQLNE